MVWVGGRRHVRLTITVSTKKEVSEGRGLGGVGLFGLSNAGGDSPRVSVTTDCTPGFPVSRRDVNPVDVHSRGALVRLNLKSTSIYKRVEEETG